MERGEGGGGPQFLRRPNNVLARSNVNTVLCCAESGRDCWETFTRHFEQLNWHVVATSVNVYRTIWRLRIRGVAFGTILVSSP